MIVLVSACLIGENCKYNGGNNYRQKVVDFLKDKTVIPVCPEVMGGLPVPRPPAEIVGGCVVSKNGISVDKEFRRGAALALTKAVEAGVEMAILQSRSPSCGVKEVYDGSFTGRKVPGMGIFAKLLKEHGIKVIDAEEL